MLTSGLGGSFPSKGLRTQASLIIKNYLKNKKELSLSATLESVCIFHSDGEWGARPWGEVAWKQPTSPLLTFCDKGWFTATCRCERWGWPFGIVAFHSKMPHEWELHGPSLHLRHSLSSRVTVPASGRCRWGVRTWGAVTFDPSQSSTSQKPNKMPLNLTKQILT